mgnify:CR=1 FL=1
MSSNLDDLIEDIDRFAAERKWGHFHTPKNLAMSVAIEAGELMEIFQWLTPEEALAVGNDPDARDQVKGEVADVLIYLLRLCSVLGIDPIEAAADKMEANRARSWPR